jgi:CheY-specific phosphatase CheX
MSTGVPIAIEPEDERQRFLESITARACEELFARYGVELRRLTQEEHPVSPEFLICSVISFSGRRVRGTLVLAMTEDLPGKSSKLKLKESVAARDWVGELSNQLLGHVKLELLRHGVEIYLNLPAVLRGEHLAPLPRKALKPLKFAAASGAVAIWVEVEMAPGFEIEGANDANSGPRSGETLLFD